MKGRIMNNTELQEKLMELGKTEEELKDLTNKVMTGMLKELKALEPADDSKEDSKEDEKPVKTKKAEKLIALKFVKHHAPYHEGEIAGFNKKDASFLMEIKVAKKA